MAAAPAVPSPERYLLHLTIGKTTHEKLRYAQALLSHAIPSGDAAQVLDRALDALIVQLERRKFGARVRKRTDRNGQRARRPAPSAGKRHIPAQVRRAVWERDRGQCSFVSAVGCRCKARRFLEFDHVVPVARGGTATVEGLRLRCRTHNQYEADRVFGAEFMSRKRLGARLAAAEARERAAPVRAQGKPREQHEDLLAGLRSLGCRGELARRAAEHSRTVEGATLEDRLRAALKFVGRQSVRARATPA
jgi:5-methylcytosine-specific restriction endonuclease McrA